MPDRHCLPARSRTTSTMICTDTTHAGDNFNPAHPLYRGIRGLAALTTSTRRCGTVRTRTATPPMGRASTPSPGPTPRSSANTWSRSTTANSHRRPPCRPMRASGRSAGSRGRERRGQDLGGREADGHGAAAVRRRLQSAGRVPHSKAAPAVTLQEPATSAADNSRVQVAADVDGSSFYEVTFEARTDGGKWASIGTDDTAPYQLFTTSPG